MKPKLLIAGAALLAFLAGAIFEGYTKLGVADAFAPPQSLATTVAPQRPASARTVAVAPQATYSEAPRVHRRRSWEREALIVAGSSGAGAAIGAAAGGGKGAGIGAVSGGVAGLVYDLATRNK